MKEVKFKDIKHTDWSNHFTLTTEQRNQLIREKLERARIWHTVLEQRKNGIKTTVR